jgi:soluble lytic murein transglycosylase-like protein
VQKINRHIARPTRSALVATLLAVAAGRAGAQADTSAVPADSAAVRQIAADSALLADSVRQVARLLVANGAPEHRARVVAAAVMKYARLRALDPLLVVGIIGVENASLAPAARSRAGARGVMQVMPSWRKDIRDCGVDMHDVHVNVCLGTAVLRIALDASASVREALLRYNGCVRAGACTRYASAVFGRAGQALLTSRLTQQPATPQRETGG